MQDRRLPLWKNVVFALIPGLVLFAAIEGVSRIVWAHMETSAERDDPNKVINFTRIFDPIVAFKLKPNFEIPENIYTHTIGRTNFKIAMHVYTNADGFMQRESAPLEKKPDSLRIMAIGESTTQGHHVDLNYPSVLRQRLQGNPHYPGGVEVINAGVSGWISDQWALESEQKLAAYRPDIVIYYAGWNDFQGYNPYVGLPVKSYYASNFSYLPGAASSHLKSIALLSALWAKYATDTPATPADAFGADDHNPDIEGLLAHGDGSQLRYAIANVTAKRERYAQKLNELEAAANKNQEKIEKRKSAIQRFDTEIKKLSDRLLSVEEAPTKDNTRQRYKFFLQNLDRSVAAFREKNPDVKIVVSTLVGRWPYESEAYFQDGNNAVLWMKQNHGNSKSAAKFLECFNALIRSNAQEKGFALIDNAEKFENVNREEIMWDFAHFTNVGYGMLGVNMYEGLRDKGLVR